MSNPVDEWMSVLGLQRQQDLARVLGKSPSRPSEWRRYGIPASAILAMQEIARRKGRTVPLHLLKPRARGHLEAVA